MGSSSEGRRIKDKRKGVEERQEVKKRRGKRRKELDDQGMFT